MKRKSEFEVGEIRTKTSFKNGEETSEERYIYYLDGQLYFKSDYTEVKKHGLEERYYQNGQLHWKRYYQHGKLNGQWKGYYKHGQPLFK